MLLELCSSYAKSSAILHKFKDIATVGNKLQVKLNYSIRLFFKKFNGLQADMGYYRIS